MASKIILSLSTMRTDAKGLSYKCFGAPPIEGVQTNEAPVKYLLSLDDKINQILCLVTPKARETAWDYFCKVISGVKPGLKIIPINIPDDGAIPDSAMADIIRQVDRLDSIYLDSSGGSRYSVMALLQLTRILEYKGIKLKKVVYANIQNECTIDDVTGLYTTQNLISGMQELKDFGKVDTLKNYYTNNTTPDGKRINKLLSAIEKMTNAITFCRVEQLEKEMAAYQTALEEAQQISDPIMQELMRVFREKFGAKVTIPWVIRWCLEHGMLAQALGIYREWIPKYLLRESGLFLKVPPLNSKWRKKADQAKYQDPDVFLWNQFLNMTQPEEEEDLNMIYPIRTLEKQQDWRIALSGFKVRNWDKLVKIGWDFLYVQALRNTVFHCNETAWMDKRLSDKLRDLNYPVDFQKRSMSEIVSALNRAVKNVEN